jgi:catechol 2,3-dioxygenase-like lactoylglutathione lyase family enzyme
MLKQAITMLPAADLDRFRSYYHDKLGLDPSAERPDQHMLEYHNGGTAFEVYETPNAGTAKNTQMVWLTDDLDAEMRRLRNAGVQFDEFELPDGMKTENGVVANDEFKAAWFHDSEGNILCITQTVR